MLGSQKSELTRKYVWASFAAITSGFQKTSPTANWPNATRLKTSASATTTTSTVASVREVHRARARSENSTANGTKKKPTFSIAFEESADQALCTA